jgi:nicotinamidase/pyrazinamidase
VQDTPGAEPHPSLERSKLERLHVGGLATHYCVENIVLDARRHGFDVVVIEDAIRGVGGQPGDSQRAVEGMPRRAPHSRRRARSP